jgi:hypothetical protein
MMTTSPNEIGRMKAEEEIESTFARYGKGTSQKVNIGVLVDATTWRRFRAHCIQEGKLAGHTLTIAMQRYLEGEKNGSNPQFRRRKF